MITVYGLRNCDTCRKALKWLDMEEIQYEFHDFRNEGIEAKELAVWSKKVGWERLLNRRSTTWRNLPEQKKKDLEEKKANKLMIANPTLIKRPVFNYDSEIIVGFGELEREALKI